jgi:phosphate/sulfate permease
MIMATVMEFAGAIGVGGRVADTIRTKVVPVKLYDSDPSVLMLGMMCALIASSLYLTMATKLGMPVSTTHSIMGGVIGMGVATVGAKNVNWGWKGVAQVFAAWAIAPGIAGAFGAIIFSVTKYGVLRRSNPVKAAFIMVPIYYAFTTGILTMLVVWKGAQTLPELSTGQIAGAIFGVAGGSFALSCFFLLPYLYRLLIKEDWQLRWFHWFMGPLLLRRGEVPPKPESHESEVRDYYAHYEYEHSTTTTIAGSTAEGADDVEKANSTDKADPPHQITAVPPVPSKKGRNMDLPIYHPKNLFYYVKKVLLHGVDQDVVAHQLDAKSSFLVGDIKSVHDHAPRYDNKAEHTYSYLQVLTAATASFAHGANDVSNAIGPLAAIFLIWETNKTSSKAPVPIWILAYGGAGLTIGLWFYGYNIMRQLGNRITLHSPSRGFSMELGSAVTVVMATRLALPVSTTQCISGATVGVGLCAGTWRAINWRMIAWIYFGWIITLPVTGIISGCLTGIILNAPQWGKVVTMG